MVEMAFEYIAFYKKYAINRWDHIGPGEYLTLLIGVSVMGYLMMMRSSNRPT